MKSESLVLHRLKLAPTHIPPSLSADGVLSLANVVTVVSIVSPVFLDFVTKWVQTPSTLTRIACCTLTDSWASRHRPVISSGKDIHNLYTGYDVAEPEGKLVRCHQGCGAENLMQNVGGSHVEVVCRRCRSSCTFEKVESSSWSVTFPRNLVITPFPQERFMVHWFPPADGQSQQEPDTQRRGRVTDKRTRGDTIIPRPLPRSLLPDLPAIYRTHPQSSISPCLLSHESSVFSVFPPTLRLQTTRSSVTGTPPLSLPPSPPSTTSSLSEPLRTRIHSRASHGEVPPLHTPASEQRRDEHMSLEDLPMVQLSTVRGRRNR